MPTAQPGDRVTIRYIGTLDNGRIFDTADHDHPYSFTIGAGEVFPALEGAIIGMKAGAAANVEIKAADAFGPRCEENLLKLPRSRFPADRELRLGERLAITFGDGEERLLRVLELNAEEVTLDGNHPLAGFDLTFALQLDAIETPER